jgi:hypothetical protein
MYAKLMLIAAVLVLASVLPAHADHCQGNLTRSETTQNGVFHLVLIEPRDREGLCPIAKSEESKVLAQCSLGRHCVVTGSGDYCADAGECWKIRASKELMIASANG